MAFSLQGFGAGFASKMSQRLDEDRIRQEKLQDEARREATRVRLAKQAQREKEKKIAEEAVGMLTMLGYSEDQAAEITKSGKLASDFWINAGQEMLLKGGDPSTLLNISSSSTAGNAQDVAAETIKAGEVPDISDITAKAKSPTNTLSGTSINLDVYKEYFGKPDKIESSFSARLAIISQKLARNPNREDAESLKQEEAKLLKDLERYTQAKREKTGKSSEPYTLGTVASNVKAARAIALDRFGFKLGMNDQIENMETGQEYLSDIAGINAVGQLTTGNSVIQSEAMNAAIRALYDSSKVGLADHAFEINEQGKAGQVSTEDFVKNAAANQYRIGQVFNDGSNLYVYTGYIDPITGMPFMTYALGG